MSPVAIGEDELESLPIHTMGAFISETSAADPHPAQNFSDTQLKLSVRKLMSVMARIAASTRTSHSFPFSKATKRSIIGHTDEWILPSRFDKCWRRIVECDMMIKAVLAQEKRAKVSLADASGALQKCPECQFQIARRLGNKL